MIICDNELCVNLIKSSDEMSRCSRTHVQLVSTHNDVKDWIMICANYAVGSPSVLKTGTEWIEDDGLYAGQIKPRETAND